MTRLPTTLNPLHIGVMLSALVLATGSCSAMAEVRAGTINIATYEQAATLQFYQRFIKEAYLRLGIATRYTPLPALRAAHSVNQGELDAILIASTDVEAGADNIVRVAEPLPSLDFRILARSDMPGETLPPGLGPYSVAYLRGIHPLERIFADKTQKLTIDSDFETLVEVLKLERVDLVALPALEANLLAQQHEGLKVLQEPVYTVSVFHYVHQNHKDLATPLAEAFRKLKHDMPCMESLARIVMSIDIDSDDDTLLAVINAPDYVTLCPASTD